MSYDPTSTEGVPEYGRERLAQMKAGFFTSDLSVNEFLLVKQAGFDPLGLVIGSSIYHIGYQQSSWKQSMEMEVLSQAMYQARELAMTRMEEEADQLGADGIVGVRLAQAMSSRTPTMPSAATSGGSTSRSSSRSAPPSSIATAKCTARRMGGRSRAIFPAKTSGRSSRQGTGPSGW